MKAVYALYADGHDAQRAVNGLRSAGTSRTRQTTPITAAIRTGALSQPESGPRVSA